MGSESQVMADQMSLTAGGRKGMPSEGTKITAVGVGKGKRKKGRRRKKKGVHNCVMFVTIYSVSFYIFLRFILFYVILFIYLFWDGG